MKRKGIVLGGVVALSMIAAAIGWDRLGIQTGERVLQEEIATNLRDGTPITWAAREASLVKNGEVDAAPSLRGFFSVSEALSARYPGPPPNREAPRAYRERWDLRRINLDKIARAMEGATFCSIPPEEVKMKGLRSETFAGLRDAIRTSLELATSAARSGDRSEAKRRLELARRISSLYRPATHWFAQFELLGQAIEIRRGALRVLELRPEWAEDYVWLNTFVARPIPFEIHHEVSVSEFDTQRNIRVDWRFDFGRGFHEVYGRVEPTRLDGLPQNPWQRANLGYRLWFSRRAATALAGASTVEALEQARKRILADKNTLASGNWTQREAYEALREFDVLADLQIQDIAHRDLTVLYRDILVEYHRTGKLPPAPPRPREDVFAKGRPYGYRLTPDGFELWTVGPDRVDNSGTSPHENRNPVYRPPTGDVTLRFRRAPRT